MTVDCHQTQQRPHSSEGKFNTSSNFSSCKSIFEWPGENRLIFDSFPMVFAILNGSLLSLTCKIASRLHNVM